MIKLTLTFKKKNYQYKLNQSNTFIVGAGAIGCELLKNLAMIGITNVTITDMDTIEKSNLSRQFLFRNSDIGKFKSEIASQKAKKMNSNISIEYKLNNEGFRTPDDFNSMDEGNIFLGCSHTFGVGLPIEN